MADAWRLGDTTAHLRLAPRLGGCQGRCSSQTESRVTTLDRGQRRSRAPLRANKWPSTYPRELGEFVLHFTTSPALSRPIDTNNAPVSSPLAVQISSRPAIRRRIHIFLSHRHPSTHSTLASLTPSTPREPHPSPSLTPPHKPIRLTERSRRGWPAQPTHCRARSTK